MNIERLEEYREGNQLEAKAAQGGMPDPRNGTVLKIFSLINYGERAGSGLNSIFYVWEHVYHTPAVINEKVGVDRVIVELPNVGHEQDVKAMLELYDNPEELTFPEEGKLYGQDSSIVSSQVVTSQSQVVTSQSQVVTSQSQDNTSLSQVCHKLSQVCHKLEKERLNNAAKTLVTLLNAPLSLKVLMESVGESNRGRMKDNILVPLLDAGLIKLTIPDIPNSPKQKYALTVKGKELFQS